MEMLDCLALLDSPLDRRSLRSTQTKPMMPLLTRGMVAYDRRWKRRRIASATGWASVPRVRQKLAINAAST